MRSELNKIDIRGKVVIGEGEMDEAPMLYIGEKVGTGKGENLEIAVDPLEGTNFAAKNLPNAISVMAVAKKGCLLSAPDTYMEKIAIAAGYPNNIIDLANTVEINIKLIFPVIIPTTTGPPEKSLYSSSSREKDLSEVSTFTK